MKGGKIMIKFTKMHGLGNGYVYIDATAKNGQKIENHKNTCFFQRRMLA